MKTRLLPFLFPVLFITALVIAGVAYQARLAKTDDSYRRLQLALKGIDPLLQKGSRLYVTDHSSEDLVHAQLQIFLPFNHIIWKDTGVIFKDSLLTIQKEDARTIDTALLRNTHHVFWCNNAGGYSTHLWLKRR